MSETCDDEPPTPTGKAPGRPVTVEQFAERLAPLRASGRVPMREIFALAKEHIDLPPAQIERLLDSPVREERVGGVSVMDKQARRKRTPPERRQELFDLYLRRHDRIDDWDLVDLGCVHVVGGWLFDRPRDVLYDLVASPRWPERRTAIVSTLYFVRKGDVGDTFALAAQLLDDSEEYVRMPVGGVLREAGKQDRGRLLAFLDEHAPEMARVTLRYATERLTPAERAEYRGRTRGSGAG